MTDELFSFYPSLYAKLAIYILNIYTAVMHCPPDLLTERARQLLSKKLLYLLFPGEFPTFTCISSLEGLAAFNCQRAYRKHLHFLPRLAFLLMQSQLQIAISLGG